MNAQHNGNLAYFRSNNKCLKITALPFLSRQGRLKDAASMFEMNGWFWFAEGGRAASEGRVP